MPRYGDTYSLSLRGKSAHTGSKAHELSKSAAAWLFENGELDQPGLRADVLRLLRQWESGESKGRAKDD